MNGHGYCPNCNADLDGEGIWDTFFKMHNSETEADRISAMYGASREHGKWGRQIGISSLELDRVTHWKCPDCNHGWKR